MTDTNRDDDSDVHSDEDGGFEWQRSGSNPTPEPDSSASDVWGISTPDEKYEDPETYTKANRRTRAEKLDDSDTEPDPADSSGTAERIEELEAKVAELEAENVDLRDTVSELENTISSLEETNTDLDEENAKLRSALSQTRTEFDQYKERTKKREDQAAQAAVTEVVEDMADVRDSLTRALDQDEGVDIREGIESTLKNFDRVLEEYGIELIDPEIGTEPDAQRHEVMMRDTSDEIAEGGIITVFSVGYERNDRVLKPAQVVVSAGTDDTDN